jgi:hypothetical protein
MILVLKRYDKAFVCLLVAIMMVACGKKVREEKIVVAKVLDKYLYLSDIQQIFSDKVSKDDSIALANAYITTWIKTQLLVDKAELNLSKEQQDIEQQIETYRSALLIHKYEEQMINQKLDTVVSDDEIEKYYNQNTSNFILDDCLVKALFIKLSKTAPGIDDVRKWYRSDQREEIRKLDSYCYNYAAKYDYFQDNWVGFDVIKNELPKSIENEDEFLRTNKYLEQADSSYLYFVYLKEHISKGSVSPFGFVKSKIRDIILNKRKVKFLSDLEDKIYNDAQDHHHFVIYNLEKK